MIVWHPPLTLTVATRSPRPRNGQAVIPTVSVGWAGPSSERRLSPRELVSTEETRNERTDRKRVIGPSHSSALVPSRLTRSIDNVIAFFPHRE